MTYIFSKTTRLVMKSKLTLRLDESLIKRAKERAKEKGTSVSQMVADYFALIESNQPNQKQKLPPITKSLTGILKDFDIQETDHKKYLEDKYLK